MTTFADRLLEWFDDHGRRDLPWQKRPTLYRVWVSEIMLQQTQVTTVIPYYERFMARFPTLKSLAQAPLEPVLERWAGLGYYSRARNLHKAAGIIASEYKGRFPRDIESVMALPGIGRSTAGAILAQALGQRHPILDGNVKRVLARYFGVEGWPGASAIQTELWHRAERLLPETRLAAYTQASMDLGATVCTRSNPRCESCPLRKDCNALTTGRVASLPSPRPRRQLPVRAVRMLLVTDHRGAVLLEKRPPSGIWGGLWSLPEAALEDGVSSVCKKRWGLDISSQSDGKAFRHTFSHYHLDITPCRVCAHAPAAGMPVSVAERHRLLWCMPEEAVDKALATPVARILKTPQVPDTKG